RALTAASLVIIPRRSSPDPVSVLASPRHRHLHRRGLQVSSPAMDGIMKVLDHTVREIKREVNLKVLKVPEIEQKVLDATSDEPWGPHGSDMADIARATKNIGECQIVMKVLWQRLGNTDANWRHLYK
uniref:ENTH domain-containing protein n=2 Tax=Aegilops tauschii TaxID=37682 RepID=A0A453FFZ1_AEGTS